MTQAPAPEGVNAPSQQRMPGLGRLLVIVYAVLALAALGRSFYQLVAKFDEAPLAYSLSAVAAVVYVLATLALVFSRRAGWYTVAWVAVVFELVGVLTVGTLSLAAPNLFGHPSVWSTYGIGYLFIPLVLPFFGMWWLATHKPVKADA